jgi:hypothetical protein
MRYSKAPSKLVKDDSGHFDWKNLTPNTDALLGPRADGCSNVPPAQDLLLQQPGRENCSG